MAISNRWRNQIKHLAFSCKQHILFTLSYPMPSCLVTELDLLSDPQRGEMHMLREVSLHKVKVTEQNWHKSG